MKVSAVSGSQAIPTPARAEGRITAGCTRCGKEARRPYPFHQDVQTRGAVLCGDCRAQWDELVADLATRWHASFRICAFCGRPYDDRRFHSTSRFGRGCVDCVLKAGALFHDPPGLRLVV